jgi:hypothetical protein
MEIACCPLCYINLQRRDNGVYKMDVSATCQMILCFFNPLSHFCGRWGYYEFLNKVRSRRSSARDLDHADEGKLEMILWVCCCPTLSLCQTHRVHRKHGVDLGSLCCNASPPAAGATEPTAAHAAVGAPGPGLQAMR